MPSINGCGSDISDGTTPSCSDAWLTAFAALVLVFLCLPVLIVAPMSFSDAQSLEFPPPGLSLRWYENLLGNPIWVEAGKNSLLLAALSSTAALICGTLASYVLVRGTFCGKRIVEANFMAPMIVPSIIIAVSLYIFFARIGLLGSFFGLVLAHTILAAPYVVLIMQAAIRSFDVRIEQVAATLGASQWQILLRIVLPNLAPSAAAAWIFSLRHELRRGRRDAVRVGHLRDDPQAHVQRVDAADQSDRDGGRDAADRLQPAGAGRPAGADPARQTFRRRNGMSPRRHHPR